MATKSLIALANERNFAALDDAWMQTLEAGTPALDEMVHVLEWLLKAKEQERAQMLCAMLLEALDEHHDPRAETVTLRVLEWFPSDQDARRVLGHALSAATADNPAMPGIVAHSGLLDDAPLAAALDYIQTRRVVRPGVYALYRSRRIPVKVVSFDPRDDVVHLHDGTHEYRATLVTYHSQYDPLSDEDFRVLQTFRVAQFRQEARSEPAALVRRFLRYAGKRATFRELREAFAQAVPADDWKDWWNSVRQTLAQDPYLEVGTGTQPVITLRDSPRDYAETRIREFDHAPSLRDKIATLLRYARDLRTGAPQDPVYADYITGVLRQLAEAGDDPVAACFAWLTLQTCAEACGCAPVRYCPQWLAEPAACLRAAHWCGWEPLFIEPLAALLPGADARWPRIYQQMLPQAPLALIEQIAAALRAHNQPALIDDMLHGLAEPRAEHAELLLWVWRELATRDTLDITPHLDLAEATFALFRVMRQLHVYRGDPEFNAHGALATVRHTIAARKYALIATVFEKIGSKNTAELYHAMSSNAGISTAMRAQLTTLLSRVGLSRRSSAAVAEVTVTDTL
jgi:hypothetical protein